VLAGWAVTTLRTQEKFCIQRHDLLGGHAYEKTISNDEVVMRPVVFADCGFPGIVDSAKREVYPDGQHDRAY
jgi:hypothetical protein